MKSLKIQLPVNKCIKSSSVIIHTQRTISQSQKKLSYQKKKKKNPLPPRFYMEQQFHIQSASKFSHRL